MSMQMIFKMRERSEFSMKQMLEDVIAVILRCARKYSEETEMQCEQETSGNLLASLIGQCLQFLYRQRFHG